MESTLTILDCFHKDTDGLAVTSGLTLSLSDPTGHVVTVKGLFKMSTPVISGKTYYVVYLPKNALPFEFCYYVISTYKELRQKMGVKDIRFTTVESSLHLGSKQVDTDVLTIYLEDDISEFQFDVSQLQALAEKLKVAVFVRDESFRKEQEKRLQLQAFISHDSRDKELIARVVADNLLKKFYRVWYDEYSLKIGDNLRESIERGIRESKKCILILTQNFLNNPGWTKKEFDSIFTKEIIEKGRVILPIWYGVSALEVYNYSTSLAGTFALQWPDRENLHPDHYSRSVDKVIDEIIKQLDKPVVN